MSVEEIDEAAVTKLAVGQVKATVDAWQELERLQEEQMKLRAAAFNTLLLAGWTVTRIAAETGVSYPRAWQLAKTCPAWDTPRSTTAKNRAKRKQANALHLDAVEAGKRLRALEKW